MNSVFIVGTTHKYQAAPKSRVGSESVEFHRYLSDICEVEKILLLAEEMSIEALKQMGADESICKRLADMRSVLHCYIDPDSSERAALGVKGEREIKLDGFFNDSSQDAIDLEVRRSHQIRESYWLEQLVKANTWPTLFVCGATHVSSFKSLLFKNKLSRYVVCEDWEPSAN